MWARLDKDVGFGEVDCDGKAEGLPLHLVSFFALFSCARRSLGCHVLSWPWESGFSIVMN